MRIKLFLVPLVLAMCATPASLWSGQAAQEPGQAPGQASPALQTAAGELSRVAPESKAFWIKAVDGSEMQFKYTDATEVTGEADSAEGLANRSGNRVSVQFHELAGEKVAAKIEVLPRS